MRILIIGGTVDSAVATARRGRGLDYRILSRRSDPTRADFLHGELAALLLGVGQ